MNPAQREILDELIASRDRFQGFFKKAASAAKRDGSLDALVVSITVKTLLGGLQWALIWYRPRPTNNREANFKLPDAMVHTLVHGLAAR